MATLLYNISQVLGITIIHSLWQGLLVYMVLRLILAGKPQLSSHHKYSLASIALFTITVWFAYTFYTEADAYNWSPSKAAYAPHFIAGLNRYAGANPGIRSVFYSTIKNYLPFISVLYAIGLVINLGKLGIAWNKIRLIKKSMIAADTLQNRVDEISKLLNIRKRIQVSYSRLVDVPCVIGYIKPTLLLPITLVFQLSAEEIETILLHELSHIKSNDYLVNIVQQIISVVLFFNPFAQLINRIIGTERENRCDDTVVETYGNPLTYAYALLKLEEARQSEVKLALAATKNKNHLLTRIERIMKTKQPIGNIRHILLAVVLFAGSVSSIAWLNPEIKTAKVAIKNTVKTVYTAVTNIKHPTAATAAEAAKTPVFSFTDDTIRQAQPADTLKNKRSKIKIVFEDGDGKKQEYSSVNDMPDSVRRDFVKNNAGNFNYNFNYDMADSARFMNDPKWKERLAAIQMDAMAMSKRFNTPEFKKQVEAMRIKGEEMARKANSPEFKKRAAEMELAAKKMGEEMQKKFNGPEFKKMQEDMQRKGKEMEEYYNGPEFKKMQDDMAKKGEEMGRYYQSPEFKKQVEDLAKLGADMGTKYINSPEFKRMQEDIVRQALDLAKEAQKIKFDYKYDNDGKPEKAERKEKAEKKEAEARKAVKKAEKKEKAEKPEKPEQPEQPETNN